jgi:hypothetical protein
MFAVRTILAMLALAFSHMVSGQWDVRAFAGPQFDDVVFELNKEPAFPRNETILGDRTFASGPGWHLGSSATLGNGALRFSFGALLSHQSLNGSYSFTHTYGGLGGNSRTVTNGELEIRSWMLEFPIQMTLGRLPIFQVHLGIAPWRLLQAEYHDSGERMTTSWDSFSGHASNHVQFDIRNNELRQFTQHGISLNAGVSTLIKSSFSIQASCSVVMSPVYRDEQPFRGHHTFLRLSLGIVLFKTSDQKSAPDL